MVSHQYAVKVRHHTPWSRVRCHGCWLTHSQFHSHFHSRRHSLRITLKYTTLMCMRSSYAWTMKPWQRSKWHLGFNSVYAVEVMMSLQVSTQCTHLQNHVAPANFGSHTSAIGAFPHTKKARFESRFKSRLFLRMSTQAEKSAIWIATIFYACPHRQKNRDPNRTGLSDANFLIKHTTHADRKNGAPALHDGI